MPARPSPLLPQSAHLDLAYFGELVGDPSRAAMVLSLMDGRERPAGEIARVAGISAATASEHLKQLVAGGLLAVQATGRHRYFRIASDEAADLLEVVTRHVTARWTPEELLRRADHVNPARRRLGFARTCHKHLAGQLGVAWFAHLERAALVHLDDGAPRLTSRGEGRLAALGFTLAAGLAGKLCLDWTERRSHVGGPLGVRLTEQLFELRWLARTKEDRAVRVTTHGDEALRRFGVAVP